MSADVVELSLEAQAERVRMAMAEVGCSTDIEIVDGKLTVFPPSEANIRGFARALDLVGYTRRCLPCALASPEGLRVAPDCEGTGRCAPDSSVSAIAAGRRNTEPASQPRLESPGSPPSPPGA